MLILATFSGIQNYLFDVRESGGKQARSLRHRSFRVQLLAEAVALRLLNAAGLPRDHLVFCAAAKVCIDAGDLTAAVVARVCAAAADIQDHLLKDTHGRLRLAVEISESSERFAHAYQDAMRELAGRKLQPWRPASEDAGWRDELLVVPSVWNPDAESDEDAAIGTRLAQATHLSIRRASDASGVGANDLLGLSVTLDRQAPESSPDLLSVSNLVQPDERPGKIPVDLFHPRRLARHIPRDRNNDPIEFVNLAACSRGTHLLGVLKADVDSLGEAISKTLEHDGSGGAQAMRSFSDALDRFFAETLEREKRGEPWNLIYTVFSGGDDMLVVGPWNIVLDFAGHMRGLFEATFGPSASNRPCASPLTISAGVAIIKPKYPVHLAAAQTDDLLDAAKGRPAPGAEKPRDQCAALGQVWKWTDHERIISDGKQLAEWVGAGVVQRGWLHTLLELAFLRRGEVGPEYDGVHPAVATSRLAYHVARNWPKNHEAREWIDGVLEGFDVTNPTDQRGRVKYLPAIVRYALLATRTGASEDKA